MAMEHRLAFTIWNSNVVAASRNKAPFESARRTGVNGA
jgi:hypothetical protein